MEMKSEKIFLLLEKYRQNTISDSEITLLANALKHAEQAKIVEQFFREEYLLVSAEIDFDVEESLAAALHKINLKNKRSITLMPKNFFYAIAASLVLFFSITLFYYLSNSSENLTIELQPIVLEMSDGTEKILDAYSASDSLVTLTSTVSSWLTGNKLVYNVAPNSISQGKNKLVVPHGRTFSLQLADGTNVRINAGSTLTFPVGFQSENERRVFLEGEAFFEVTKNENKPFIVNTINSSIEVTGTAFNVSAYEDDVFEKTTLTEGSVQVSFEGVSSNLIPNEQAVLNKKSNILNKSAVDVQKETAWLKGQMIFEGAPFSEIATRLERRFNVTIEYNKADLAAKQFTANFEGEKIEQIIEFLAQSYGFDYKIEASVIYVQ